MWNMVSGAVFKYLTFSYKKETAFSRVMFLSFLYKDKNQYNSNE